LEILDVLPLEILEEILETHLDIWSVRNFAQTSTLAASLVVGTLILSKILQHASTALQLMVDSGTASCSTGRDLYCALTFKLCAFCPGKFTTLGEV
jgi:hypothetical protein